MRWTRRMLGDREGRLRPGAVVEVKSAAEILATLDHDGAVDALPFMPEMLQFAGRRFTVSKRAEQSCDTIRTWRSRRMRAAVHLDDLRCDGSGHAGCQAGCLLYWKESWLKPVNAADASPRPAPAAAPPILPVLLANAVQQPPNGDSAVRYRCQATEMFRATEPLRSRDLRRYLREVWSGNVGPVHLVTVLAKAAYRAVRIRAKLDPNVPLRGTCEGPTPRGDLDLQPGEWVRVKSGAEIAGTLKADSKNRGLWFDWEMLPHCGRTYRVKQRVTRIVDDRSGELIQINSDNLILDGVACSGDLSSRRLFCPRAIYPYWREVWLERVASPEHAPPTGPRAAPAESSP
jgi:hypothetical protein